MKSLVNFTFCGCYSLLITITLANLTNSAAASQVLTSTAQSSPAAVLGGTRKTRQLPECATQQVCNALFVRRNHTQSLCECSSNYNWSCSSEPNAQDGHTIELTRRYDKKVGHITIFRFIWNEQCPPKKEAIPFISCQSYPIITVTNSYNYHGTNCKKVPVFDSGNENNVASRINIDFPKKLEVLEREKKSKMMMSKSVQVCIINLTLDTLRIDEDLILVLIVKKKNGSNSKEKESIHGWTTFARLRGGIWICHPDFGSLSSHFAFFQSKSLCHWQILVQGWRLMGEDGGVKSVRLEYASFFTWYFNHLTPWNRYKSQHRYIQHIPNEAWRSNYLKRRRMLGEKGDWLTPSLSFNYHDELFALDPQQSQFLRRVLQLI